MPQARDGRTRRKGASATWDGTLIDKILKSFINYILTHAQKQNDRDLSFSVRYLQLHYHAKNTLN